MRSPVVSSFAFPLPGFAGLHPDQLESDQQGALALLHTFERDLCDVVGMHSGTFNPSAGAHGEITALLMWRKYFQTIGQPERDTVLIPHNRERLPPITLAAEEPVAQAVGDFFLAKLLRFKPLGDFFLGFRRLQAIHDGRIERDAIID